MCVDDQKEDQCGDRVHPAITALHVCCSIERQRLSQVHNDHRVPSCMNNIYDIKYSTHRTEDTRAGHPLSVSPMLMPLQFTPPHPNQARC